MSLGKLQINRREFLKVAGAGVAAAPLILSGRTWGSDGVVPSERITVGVVGVGSRGTGELGRFIYEPDVQVVALCDVDPIHYRDKEWGQGIPYGLEPAAKQVKEYYERKNSKGSRTEPDTYTDYRELCARDDIDVVVVATPDHWHALCTLEALRNGKDVFCEKPLTHLFPEGQAVYREAAKRNAVFQTGSQQRSEFCFRRAVELVLNGHIGKVKHIEVGLPDGYDKPMGDTFITDPPERMDYDLWCGPSLKLPYMRARHHRFWRGHTAYGGGVLMDFIGHHNDIAHWSISMDNSGPNRVEAINWEFPKTDIYDTPQNYEIQCEYPGGITSSIANKHTDGIKWHGEDGWIYASRQQLKASDMRWTEEACDPGAIKAYTSDHHERNLLDCVKSRKACIAPAETAHRSVTPGHLGYVSHHLGRALQWDPVKEAVVNDEEANTLLNSFSYRAPWKLES